MLYQAEGVPHSGPPAWPFPERRQKLRHKVHSPAYATRDHESNIILPHLNEIVDIGEDGMCFQNSSPLVPGEVFKVCLDLSETNVHIEAEGEVVWSRDSGRTGVRFQRISKESLQQLREWLFANSLTACVNHSDSDFPVKLDVSSPLEPSEITSLLPDHTTALTAVAAIEREVSAAAGSDVDGALQIIVDRALALTRATGSAIALSGGENMTCRASSGSDAPPVGAMLKAGSGFSGECVRTGQLLHCEDAESDPRVDRESCKALGVRSMIAAPVRVQDSVHGILEVFSPQARIFTESDKEILQRLAGIVSQTVTRAAPPVAAAASVDSASEADGTSGSSPALRLLIALVAAAVISLLALVVIPRVRSKTGDSVSTSQQIQRKGPPVQTVSLPDNLDALRNLAEQGDATAQFALGARYATGEDVKQDYTEAARWFLLAADQGESKAQSVLAAYYWDGTGVQKDLGRAYFWAILARANQDEPSKARAAELATRLTYDQRTSIQQQADDWLRQHTLRNTASSQ